MSESDRIFKNNNEAAEFYYRKWGVNPIPFDTKFRRPILRSFKEYLDNPIPESIFKKWKEEGKFDKGFNIVCGKVWQGNHIGLYLIGIDIDKELGIREFCKINGKETTLQELSNITVVDQHNDDLKKAHIYFYSPFPFPSKGADSIIGIEVKGERMMITPAPNIHHKNGYCHEFIGDKKEPAVLSHGQAIELMRYIDDICSRHGLKYLEKSNRISTKLRKMIKSLTINYEVVINQGERNHTLLSIADSLLITHHHSKKEGKTKIDKLQEFLSEIKCKTLSTRTLTSK